MTIKSFKRIKQYKDKVFLVRCDFNVPIEKGQIKEDYKLKQSLATINFLISQGAKVVLISHLGRPQKREVAFSLKPVAERLSHLLGSKVFFSQDIVGLKAKKAIKKLSAGEVLLLDNIRFLEGEEKNSRVLAKQLASLADIYINEAFAVSHRLASSVSAIKNYLPAYAGLLLEKEVENLAKAFKPKKPLVVIVGGAKVKSKIKLLEKLLKSADSICLGGALANTFLAACGINIGKSLIDEEGLVWAKNFISKKTVEKKIVLPLDALVLSQGKKIVKKVDKLKKTEAILDIGPETMSVFCKQIKLAKTVIWNGPLGKFEDKRFQQGTLSVARQVAISSTKNTFSVVGGGETVEALAELKASKNISWISTGGGAMLSFLAGEKMPGLEKIVKL
ncbi:MAG: phosphoglycerate kinase [Candidatus Pacebacteria bacterium]|nr:phosphoglycerate kinase [Candidatus Paceibacterota bacterium]